MDKYLQFSLEDFLRDDFFKAWVRYPDKKNTIIWARWLELHPEMVEKVQQAKEIIQAFENETEGVTEDFYNRLKERIDTSISIEDNKKGSVRSLSWLKIAAIVAGLFLGGSILFYSHLNPRFVTINSRYAETKTIFLPDSSEVMLNAHSSIKYSENWTKENREVWLSGEAFFSIKHIENSKRKALSFVVHADNINVAVLGTRFNINSSDDNKKEVLLTSGKIKLSVTGNTHKPLTIEPGQLASYSADKKFLQVSKVSTEKYIAWMRHKCILDKTSLADVCKQLRGYYGKSVTIEDGKMSDQLLSGTLELQNKKALVATLSALLGVKVEESSDKISIYSK